VKLTYILQHQNYGTWLRRLLDSVMVQLEAKDQTFTQFLLEIPELYQDVIERVKIYCNDPDRIQLGLATLKEIAIKRPSERDFTMEILLHYAIHKGSVAFFFPARSEEDSFNNAKGISDRITRSSAIITIKKWAPDNPVIARKIEDFALQSLNKLCLPSPPPSYDYHYHVGREGVETHLVSESQHTGKVEWTEAEAVRHLELFCALCAKKHELFDE
jgi:hypothetical protein